MGTIKTMQSQRTRMFLGKVVVVVVVVVVLVLPFDCIDGFLIGPSFHYYPPNKSSSACEWKKSISRRVRAFSLSNVDATSFRLYGGDLYEEDEEYDEDDDHEDDEEEDDDEDEEDEEDHEDDDEEEEDVDRIDPDLLGDWRTFRKNLAMSETMGSTSPTQESTTSITTVKSVSKENEELLLRQNEQLGNEYVSGVWAHPVSTVRLGCDGESLIVDYYSVCPTPSAFEVYTAWQK